jgi:CDP-diacylglycerol--serine O-phosphatidyltransferase
MRRGASILPSLFTTGNLFLGYWAIIKALNGQLEAAAPLIGWAILLDALDGRIARLTGTTSEFGGELDSLADVISFGVAPALLAFMWGLGDVARVGWLASFLFLMCGTLRLARFNVQRHAVDGRYFVGLPIPAAAAQVASVVYFLPGGGGDRLGVVFATVGVVVLAFLMVSTFRYHSFKGVDLRQRRSYITVLGIAILFLLVALDPQAVLLGITVLYTLSGPIGYLYGLVRRRREPLPAETSQESQ